MLEIDLERLVILPLTRAIMEAHQMERTHLVETPFQVLQRSQTKQVTYFLWGTNLLPNRTGQSEIASTRFL